MPNLTSLEEEARKSIDKGSGDKFIAFLWFVLAFSVYVGVLKAASSAAVQTTLIETLQPFVTSWTATASDGVANAFGIDLVKGFSAAAIDRQLRRMGEEKRRPTKAFVETLKRRREQILKGEAKPEKGDFITLIPYLFGRSEDLVQHVLVPSAQQATLLESREGFFQGGVVVSKVFITHWMWYGPLLIGSAYVIRDLFAKRDQKMVIVKKASPRRSGGNT